MLIPVWQTVGEGPVVASLNGIIFDQIYGDNTGGAEFDTDGDGTATQEDEFVSFTNTTGSAIDVSGWQVWTDSTGVGAYGNAQQDGLYHTFPPGTVIQPGETLYIVTEFSGTPPSWAQEASEGGTETTTTSSNFISEGGSGTASESLALVDPDTGDFLVFNMSSASSEFASFDGGGSSSNTGLAGFPGSTMIAEIDGHSVQDDMNAGSSYRYDSGSDSYTYAATTVPCMTPDTMIDTPEGPRRAGALRVGDRVLTDGGQPKTIRLVLKRHLSFERDRNATQRPIEFKPGSLGKDAPHSPLVLSPNHRVLVTLPDGRQVLAPAKALIDSPGVRLQKGKRAVTYINLVLSSHSIIRANGAAIESYLFGDFSQRSASPRLRHALHQLSQWGLPTVPACQTVGAAQLHRLLSQSALGLKARNG